VRRPSQHAVLKVSLPKGRNVVSQVVRRTRITQGGVTVAKEIEIEDKFENRAPEVSEVASKSADAAGDGPQPRSVLAAAIVKEGASRCQPAMNPSGLKQRYRSPR